MTTPTLTLVGLGASVLGPFVAFRAYGRWVMALDESTEEKVHRLSRANVFGLTVLAPAVCVLVWVLDVIGTLEAVLARLAPGVADSYPAVVVLALVAFFVPVALVYVSVVLALLPYDRALRDTELAAVTAVRKTLLGLCAIVVPGVGWLLLIGVLPDAWLANELFLVVVLGAFLFSIYATAPYLILVFGDTHRLEGERLDELVSFCRDLGVEPRDVRVIETDGAKQANAVVAGTVPGFVYVFLTDYLLQELTADEVEAIVAHEVGHVVGRHLWYRAGAAVVVFGLWIVGFDAIGFDALADQFGFLGFFVPFVVGFLVYYLFVHGTMAVRQEFDADRFAAEGTSVETTTSALESLATANHTKATAGRLYELATVHPSIEDRVERLRGDR